MHAGKPREIAARVLGSHADGDEHLEHLLDRALTHSRLGAADRALVHELCCGVVRWQATLDWLIAQKATARKPHIRVQLLLRLGLYQLFWLERVPDHAAVHETVELAHGLGLAGQAGFINAVLRTCLREREQIERGLAGLKDSRPAIGWSHPEWLVRRWEQRWGADQLQQLLAWNNTPPVTYARLNTLRTTAEQLTAAWAKEEVVFEERHWEWSGDSSGEALSIRSPLTPSLSASEAERASAGQEPEQKPAPRSLIFELKSHPPLKTLPSLQKGWFYVQDPSTVLAVREINPRPGEAVLDVCAAPGGKTTLSAQFMRNEGRIIAQEIDARRRALLRANCERLGVTCVRIVAPGAIVLPDTQGPFDRALVDVPCSNTGVLRRRVDLRWRIRAEAVRALARTQAELLSTAANELKPGGTLVYSTCSLEREENEEVVRQFLEERKEFSLERERQLLPFVDGVDGAYVARLRRG